jgi:radical SAM protein with 4Fe4S-binding SPASM domain
LEGKVKYPMHSDDIREPETRSGAAIAATRYPCLADGVSLHLQPYGARLIQQGADPYNPTHYTYFQLNQEAARILSLCNGRNSYGEILRSISREYYSNDFDVVQVTGDYIVQAIGDGTLRLHDEPTEAQFRIGGSTDYFSPQHAAFELTDGCNLRCLHCYRECEPGLGNWLDAPDALRILSELAEIGVRTIELTGGEPTLHPRFREIIEFSLRKFNIVALITNGVLLNDELVRVLAEQRNHVVVQIDVDGDTGELHDYLRGVPGSFQRTLQTARLLTQHGVKYRAAMNIHAKNFDSVRATARLVHGLGATWFSFAPILDIGRASGIELVRDDQIRSWEELKREIEAEFPPGFVNLGKELERRNITKGINCGAGSRSLVIGPTGLARPCLMMSEDLISYGNLCEQSLVEILKTAPSGYLYELPAPTREICGDCPMFMLCGGCIARPIHALKEIKEKGLDITCAWNEKYRFTDLVPV